MEFRSAVRIATDLALITIFALSLNTGHWIVPTDATAASEKARTLADAINPWVGISVAVALVITSGMLLLEIRRLAVRGRPRPGRGRPLDAA